MDNSNIPLERKIGNYQLSHLPKQRNQPISGIYAIINSVNETIYVGGSKNLHLRKKTHFRELSKNKHHCQKLQTLYHKHGKDIFSFLVIEFILVPKKEVLLEREQFYLDTIENKFNTHKTATTPLGVKKTKETCLKLSGANKGKKHSKEYKQKMSERLSGKQNPMYGTVGFLSPNFGKKHKESTKKLMSENHADFSGSKNPNFGKKQTPEATAKSKITKRARRLERHGKILIYKDNELIGEGVTTYECADIINTLGAYVAKSLRENKPYKDYTFKRVKADGRKIKYEQMPGELKQPVQVFV